MIEITKKLESFLQSIRKRYREASGINEETPEKETRVRVWFHFGNFPDEKGKLLVIPANLDIEETVKKMVNLEKEVMSFKSQATEIQRIVDQSAEHLPNVILDMKWTMPWPILPSDSSVDQFPVPECLLDRTTHIQS